jgi:hypothetical protein
MRKDLFDQLVASITQMKADRPPNVRLLVGRICWRPPTAALRALRRVAQFAALLGSALIAAELGAAPPRQGPAQVRRCSGHRKHYSRSQIEPSPTPSQKSPSSRLDRSDEAGCGLTACPSAAGR